MTYQIGKQLKWFCITLMVTLSPIGMDLNAHAHVEAYDKAIMEGEIDCAQRSTYESDAKFGDKLFNAQEHCSQLQAKIDSFTESLDASEALDANEKLDKRKTQNLDDNETTEPSPSDQWEEWRWEGKD